MKPVIQGKIGVSNLHFIAEKELAVFDILKYPYLTEFEFEKESEEIVEFADDIIVYQASISTKGSIKAKTKDMPMAAYKFLYGSVEDDNGVLIDNVNDIAPEIACVYRETLTDGYYRYVCIPRVKGIKPKMGSTTKSDKISIQDEELNFNVAPLESGHIAYYFTTNDLESPVAKGWFEKIYQPKNETPTI